MEQGDDYEVVGSKGIVKKVELVRTMVEALYSLGYNTSGACLEEESGILLHSDIVKVFMQQIIDGKWDESIATLQNIGQIDTAILNMASLEIFEQKYFELLNGEMLVEALTTLRTEIAPLCGINSMRLRELCVYILHPSQGTPNGASSQESRQKLLKNLRDLLPTLMIPEKRLVNLVEQALGLQIDACRFHNSLDAEVSLLANHHCGRGKIPSETVQILDGHSDEVWFLQFSHNGKYLASSSSDCVVIIWEVHSSGQVSERQRLRGHQSPVSYIAWRLDDLQLLTCGSDEAVRRWDVSSGLCLHTYKRSRYGIVSCAWAPDGQSIFTGFTDKSIRKWNLQGRQVERWRGHKTMRIADFAVTKKGTHITICRENAILLLERESRSEQFIEEDQIIVSFSLSEDDRFLLVSLLNEELHLWNIDGPPEMVRKYRGHKRSRFVVRSCFGGREQGFIASGSEDSQVYIWLRASGELICTLAGHTGVVNCVSWNPANPHMLASAGDDRTIRIWGLEV